MTTGLQTGGAEVMLSRIVTTLKTPEFYSKVVALRGNGRVHDLLTGAGVEVESLGVQGAFSIPSALRRLRRCVRVYKPDIIQGWLAHGNLTAAVATALSGKSVALLWNVRQSLYDLDDERVGTRMVIRTTALLSACPTAIIYNSATAARHHERIGYPPRKTVVIQNGFDLMRFRPDPAMRTEIRNELGISATGLAVGMMARYHPMKDHATMLDAFQIVSRTIPQAVLVLAGRDVTESNTELMNGIERRDLSGRVRLLGQRNDTERIYRAFDVAVLSSFTESFPNAVGEAMASGVPCISTDVGDARTLVGDTGVIVPPRDPAAMADACLELLLKPEEERAALGLRARERVVAGWSLSAIASQYARIYRGLSPAS